MRISLKKELRQCSYVSFVKFAPCRIFVADPAEAPNWAAYTSPLAPRAWAAAAAALAAVPPVMVVLVRCGGGRRGRK